MARKLSSTEKIKSQAKLLKSLSGGIYKESKKRVTIYDIFFKQMLGVFKKERKPVERINLYELKKGGAVKYRTWISKKKFRALLNDRITGNKQNPPSLLINDTYRKNKLPEGFKRVRLEPQKLRIRVKRTVHTKKGKKVIKQTRLIFAYTKTQQRETMKKLNKGKIMVNAGKGSRYQEWGKITRLIGDLKTEEIETSSGRGGSP